MFGFDSKDVFCLFSPVFLFFGSEMETPKHKLFFFWIDMIHQDLKKTKKQVIFWCVAFETISNHNNKSKNTKKELFFEILVDSMYAKKTMFVLCLAFETKTKKLGKTKIYESKPNIILKVLVFFCVFPRHPQDLWFCFFVFQRFCGFGDSRYLYII